MKKLVINDASFVENELNDRSVKFFDGTVQEIYAKLLENQSDEITL